MSWWDFGEWSGFDGDELATHRIVCGFCNEEGRFAVVHHQAKANQSGKALNYDTLKCDACGNLTMAFWSAARGGRIHDFKTLPWPRATTRFPEHWPDDVGRYWLQRSL